MASATFVAQGRVAKLYFLYLRTRLDVEFDDATDYAAGILGDRPELLAPYGDYDTFANGFVARAYAESAAAFVAKWGRYLAMFEAWAIHDGFDDVIENIGGGPVQRALRATRKSIPAAMPVTQAFIVFHSANQEPPKHFDPDRATDSILSQWRAPAQGAFHFRNGRVLFVANEEPIAIMAHRMEGKIPRFPQRGRSLRKDVYEIAFYDSGNSPGLSYYGNGPAWKNADIYDDDPGNESEPGPFR